MRLTVSELLEAVGGELLCGNSWDSFEFVSTDTRETLKGKLFIPLKGENFDGHNYIEKALKDGAKGYLTEKDEVYPFPCFAVKVADTKKALGALAEYVLKRSGAFVIGITGSVGKTTTRQFIASVVSKVGKTVCTHGNLNNHIGLPLSILRMDGDEKFAVLEMGMSAFGEISYLSKIAKPDLAVITLIGTSHIEFLGSRENILKAKLEILDGMKTGGKLIFNGEDSTLCSLKNKYDTLYYGLKNTEIISDSPSGIFKTDNEEYEIDTAGRHNIINASCAILIGKLLGASYTQIKDGLKAFEQEENRQKIEKANEKTIITDCYNASLDSDLAALSVLNSAEGKRKVAILGGIGEMGVFLEDTLKEVGAAVYKNNVDLLICTDENSHFIMDGALKAGMNKENILHFESKNALLKNIDDILKDGDTVLIKASHKYKFEEISEYIIKKGK